MKKTGGELVRYALEQIGARFTFGIPGVHNTEIYDQLNMSNAIKSVLVTHECGAAFMADAISRTTSSIGVCLVVPAAGLTHAMSGVGEAFLDGIPMLVMSGGTRTDIDHGFQLHQMDQKALMAPLTKAQFTVMHQDEIVETIYKAYEIAVTGEPGPVYIEVPVNLQLLKAEVSELKTFTPPTKLGASVSDDQINEAVDMLVAAKKPGMFIGWGSRSADKSTLQIAELLGAPIATSLQGLAAVPHDHPLHTGMGFGVSAVPAAENAFADCDCMLAVGIRFAEIATGSFGVNPPENLIHIDINKDAIGRNYPAKIGIEGDAGDVMPRLAAALAERITENRNAAEIIKSIADDKAAYKQLWADHDSKGRVNPGLFFECLDKAVDDNAIIVTDDGNHTFLTAELMPITKDRKFISPTDFNCMGYCIPAVNAAKLANREKQVIGIVGDGALLMTGMEALTAQGEGLGSVYIVFADGELSQIAQAQEVPYNRKPCTALPPMKLEGLAMATGAGYVKIATNKDIAGGLKAALAEAETGKPVFVDVAIDYSKKTRFTEGAIKTNFNRFDTMTKLRMVGRAMLRKVTG
jgi:acetolactate synthase-1/2/3 large subunit